jgi:hypothetical protein
MVDRRLNVVNGIKKDYEKATKIYERALDYADRQERWSLPPTDDEGWTMMWQAVNRASGIEASLRRSEPRFTGCLYGNNGCPENSVASCLGHE